MRPDKIAEVLKELGLSNSRVSLVAGHAMLVAPSRRLLANCPGVEFVALDDAIQQLRIIKSPYELELMREAAQVGDAAMLAMMHTALIQDRGQSGCRGLQSGDRARNGSDRCARLVGAS